MYWMSRYFMRSLSAVLTLRRYCKIRLEDPRTKYLHIPATHDVTVPVDELFVPLVLENQIGTQEGFTHATLLEAGTRILVLGDPGSGKSSLLKKVFRESCSNALSTWVTPKTHLPVLVELKNLEVPTESEAESKSEWFLNQIEREVCRTEAYRMNECFQAYSRTAGLLILLDGLDEISSAKYSAVRDAINGLSILLAERGENNVVILTTRTQFHLQVRDDFSASFPVVLSLRPFSPTDIYRFLSRWAFPKSTKGALSEISRIYKDLTNRSNVRDMCRNPLVLSMYVAADQASGGGQPPESRVEFYGKVTEELVTRRRQRQTGLAGSAVKLRQQREELLGRLAYKHLVLSSESANRLSWPTAVDEVVRSLKCSRDEAESYLRELSNLNYAQIRRSHRRWSCGGSGSRVNSVI